MTGRYLLFTGEPYTPNGGWRDFAGAYETVEAAVRKCGTPTYTWAHVVDLVTLRAVAIYESYTEEVQWSYDPETIRDDVQQYVADRQNLT